MKIVITIAPLAALLALSVPLGAEAPRILSAEATPEPTGWTVSVTFSHPDSGWDHYASGWEVLDPEGEVLARPGIPHPHDGAPEFTESVAGVPIPPEVDHVTIRSRCNLDGWAARSYRLDLRQP